MGTDTRTNNGTDEIGVQSVVVDMSIYPRAGWSQETVNRYAEAINAGDQFPAIVLEPGTNRLLDGMHRLQAHKQALKNAIAVAYQEVPDGVPAKLFAASLSSRHGDRMSSDDLRGVIRETLEANPDYDMKVIARMLSITRQTVSKWGGDIVEQRRTVRKVRGLLLKRAGWSLQQIADFLGISKGSVVSDVNGDIPDREMTEDLLREAATGLPASVDVEAILEEVREERIFAAWSDDERDLLKRLRSGETVVVTLRGAHNNLIAWADQAGLYMRIDRKSEWGNPFEMPGDGDRETVIRNYGVHYLPYKPTLLGKLPNLQGKALGCWCAPEPCHGDILKTRAGA